MTEPAPGTAAPGLSASASLSPPIPDPERRILFLYWGRRGALSWIAAELAESFRASAGGGNAVSFSTDNELAGRLERAGTVAWPFRTFSRGPGALTGLLRFRRQARALVRRLKDEGFAAVVVLMPHVWTPLLGRAVKRAGLRYAVVIHDAAGHPGDPTGLVNNWLLRDARAADVVVALTEAVADRLATERGISRRKIAVVPHPAVDYGDPRPRRNGAGPLRILFLGRIMAYKGLALLVDAAERLRASGDSVSLGVYGEGDIGALRPRLAALGAAVVNRWIDHAEIGPILAAHDVLALPYTEASQSGVAAAAHGAGMPIVATPVGGLAEQVLHGVDGLLAEKVSADAVAASLRELARDRQLYARLAEGAAARRRYTVPNFAARLKEVALGHRTP